MLRDPAIPGEHIRITIQRAGDGPDQGIGYLPDGTMVVVEDAQTRIDLEIEVVITNTVQTSAGRLVFAKVSPQQPANIKDSATQQARHTGPGPNHPSSS